MMGKSKEDEGILRLAVRSKIKKMFEVKKSRYSIL